MLGILIDGLCIVFGNNLWVVTNAINPTLQLKKKHLGIAFHFVQEVIAAGIIHVCHIDSSDNMANPLTKLDSLTKLKIIEDKFFYWGDDEKVDEQEN